MTRSLSGLIAATFSPFDDDGALRLDNLDDFAQHLARHKVTGVFVCGTTGEFASMTTDERMKLAARWKEVAGDELAVIVHVGHTCIRDSQALAAHAQSIGADGIAAIGPYFFRPRGATELVESSKAVASSAPGLPFYYYHLPQLSGVDVNMLAYIDQARASIPNFRGVKFSLPNLEEYGLCMKRFGDQLDIPFGSDQVLLAALSMGATSTIGTTYCFMAPLYQDLIQAFQTGKLQLARSHQTRSLELISVFMKYGGLPAMKTCMRLLGLDVGPVRGPLKALDASAVDQLSCELDQCGFLQQFSWSGTS